MHNNDVHVGILIENHKLGQISANGTPRATKLFYSFTEIINLKVSGGRDLF